MQNKIDRDVTSITLTFKLSAKHIDKKYYIQRVNGYLANQSVNDFIFKKPDPKTLLYHFPQWLEPDLGL